MNITITQDNSRVEVLGSNGAGIIEKLYELAIDPNNTLTLEGNISSTSAYADLVSYLTTNYPDLIISAMNLYIRFEDSKAATVCSEYFGDGVGCSISNLSTASFSTTKNGVTFINALKNAGVEKFNELRYCTNITSIPSNAFSDYTTLTQIDLRNINSIENNAFKGCTGLTSVTFSTNAYTIDYEAFENCTGLTSVDLSDITAIGKDVFRGCPNLTSVKIGPSVNKLTYRALSGMGNQPNTVLYLPLITNSAESELASISHLHYSVGSFSYNAFGQYNSQNSTNSIWGQIYLPNLTHPSAGWCAFPNYLAPLSSITVDLIYLKNISALGVGMFGGSYLKALVINSTTPPQLMRDNERKWDSFSRLMQADGIYVPDGYESAYATAWANVNPPETFESSTLTYIDVLSKIKPMSLLSRYATELAWITAGRPVALIEEYMS